jgi:hypothetical protein
MRIIVAAVIAASPLAGTTTAHPSQHQAQERARAHVASASRGVSPAEMFAPGAYGSCYEKWLERA